MVAAALVATTTLAAQAAKPPISAEGRIPDDALSVVWP
jgi:hypothetical protein